MRGIGFFFYSSVNIPMGVIFRILKDIRQANKKAADTMQIPETVKSAAGISNVHLIIPIPFKNRAIKGFIITALMESPIMADKMSAGRKLAAV